MLVYESNTQMYTSMELKIIWGIKMFRDRERLNLVTPETK